MKRNLQALIWGIALIVVGVIILLNMANVLNVNIWSYIIGFLFLFGGISAITNSQKNMFGYFLIILGIFIILRKALNWDFSLLYIIPIILIIAGVSFLINVITSDKIKASGNAFVVFSGREDTSFPPDYQGSNITCFFGGYEIDLREHKFVNDLSFNIFTMFGGAEIIVPENVNIVIKPTAILGGVSNVTKNTQQNEFTVYVNALCLLGGVEVVNYKKQKR
ncbi:MAG: LiaF transmembrane domain-containing protein [Bacillota bacterium]